MVVCRGKGAMPKVVDTRLRLMALTKILSRNDAMVSICDCWLQAFTGETDVHVIESDPPSFRRSSATCLRTRPECYATSLRLTHAHTDVVCLIILYCKLCSMITTKCVTVLRAV